MISEASLSFLGHGFSRPPDSLALAISLGHSLSLKYTSHIVNVSVGMLHDLLILHYNLL